MRSLAISIAMIIVGESLALPPVRPVLPPVAHDDAETTTNVPFAAWQDCAGKFRFSLTCRTTPTNNVQIAFGTDADGDGVLSLSPQLEHDAPYGARSCRFLRVAGSAGSS